jgi:phosphodiesterase/alkaline phosphatase D-like protein
VNLQKENDGMERRKFLVAAAVSAGGAGVMLSSAATAREFSEYSRTRYEENLASGKPFMLDFFASW